VRPLLISKDSLIKIIKDVLYVIMDEVVKGEHMYKINDILKPREEVLRGAFQGVIQTHKLDTNENRLENNPHEFLQITYPSAALKRTLERIEDKLFKKSNQGAFLLVGPYGTGKSHTLITLYHLFNNPSLAKKWGEKWKIDFALPNNSRSIIISTRRYAEENIWEPMFTLAGKEDLLKKIKMFPTVDQIEELIGDKVVAIFIDEIENWYGSFDPQTQAHLIERNETFLEHLFEVANDPKKNLFIFVTFLEEKEGLKKIFNRTKPIRLDVSAIEDREKVILHRLFENIESVDKEKIENIVEKYIENYTYPIKIDDPLQYKNRMMRTYPFHPLLLDTLTQIYEAATERQDIRGMLNVLADAVKDTCEQKDLILLADIDENAFRGIDLHLVEKYSFDFQRVKDIGYAREILKTVLIFTLNEKTHGATESDILLSIYSPTQGHTLNSILVDLENIYGKPHYLHKENEIYLFKHEINLYALLEREKSKISDDDIKRKISEIVKREVFDNKAFIYGFDEIPDDNKVKIVVLLESWGVNDQLRNKLNKFYKGRTWQNTYILILPEVKNVISFELLEKAKRLLAAEVLRTQVKDKEGKLSEIIQEEIKAIAEKIKSCYGYFIKWVEREEDLIYRLINVNADISSIREKAGSDEGLCADFIVEQLKDKPNGVKIKDIISDFKRFRRYPFILGEDVIYGAIRNLHKDKRVIIQGERAKWYIDEIPKNLEPDFVVFDPKYAPSFESRKETDIITVIEEDKENNLKIAEGEAPFTVQKKERKEITLNGNSPRVILSQIEARTSEKDEFEEIKISYKFNTKLSKQEIMKLIKQLPLQEDIQIKAEVLLWREKDEL